MLSSYGLQRIVPDRIRGRIFAFDFMFVTLTFGLSSVITGALVDVFGPKPTAVGLGLVGLAWAAVWTVFTTDVRRATMQQGAGATPELPQPAG
jgi:MFS family permease